MVFRMHGAQAPRGLMGPGDLLQRHTYGPDSTQPSRRAASHQSLGKLSAKMVKLKRIFMG